MKPTRKTAASTSGTHETASNKPAVRAGVRDENDVSPAPRRRARRASEPRAFVEGPTTTDPLAEAMGEAAVRAMTSGEDDPIEDDDAEAMAQAGGPFVITTAAVEMADDTLAPNIPSAERAPFPTTRDVGNAAPFGRTEARAGVSSADDAELDGPSVAEGDDDE